MKRPKHLKAIFVDMDGTLADSLSVLFDVYAIFMKKYGQTPTSEEFCKLKGPSLKEIIKSLKDKYQWIHSEEDLFQEYQRQLEIGYAGQISLMPGSREVIAFARDKGLACVLVTSASDKLVRSFLRNNQLEKEFNMIITGDLVSKSKPDPEIYRLALIKANIRPFEAIAIEDSSSGIKSATGAFIPTFWLNGRHDRLHEGNAERVDFVSSWAEILTILQSWYG